MAVLKHFAVGLLLLAPGRAGVAGVEKATLREAAEVGTSTQVLVTLKADGFYQPAPPPGPEPKEPPKPLKLRVETQLAFAERVLKVGADGRATRVVRQVAQADSVINGEVRPLAAALRPEARRLLAELRTGTVVVYSPDGPLTRPELELVEGAGDPLILAGLLPTRPVAQSDRWTVARDAVRSLSSYDALASNSLEATLISIDDATATLTLRGQIRGAALGGEGTITCEGSATFDRKAGRVSRLELTRTETRKPGPVEAGLDIKSTLVVERRTVATPDALNDAAIAGLPASAEPDLERLLFVSPDGKYSLRHDRDWHLFWDDRRVSILKRLDHGEVVAQCNLTAGPAAGKGRHQDLGQFRDDIKRALGERFVQFLGAGEIDGDAAGGFRYKVGVQGRQSNVGVLWDYYLVASPDGDQLLVTFTLGQEHAKAFGTEDERVVGSLRWNAELAADPKGTTR
jgi:hypothetical protein